MVNGQNGNLQTKHEIPFAKIASTIVSKETLNSLISIKCNVSVCVCVVCKCKREHVTSILSISCDI